MLPSFFEPGVKGAELPALACSMVADQWLTPHI